MFSSNHDTGNEVDNNYYGPEKDEVDEDEKNDTIAYWNKNGKFILLTIYRNILISRKFNIQIVDELSDAKLNFI